MKTVNLSSLLLTLLITTTSVYSQSKFGVEKDVIIAGIITEFNSNEHPAMVEIIRRDFFDLNEKLVETIKNDGSFQFTFPIAYTQEFYLKYGTLISLLATPGDSIYIEIDNGILNDKNLNKNLKFAQNKTGKTNELLIKFVSELPNEQHTYDNANNAVKDKSPEEYTQYINTREKEYRAFLKQFKKDNRTTKLFDKWAEDRLTYESWQDLMRYRWTHPYYNQMDENTFTLPNSYFNFLKKYDMNEKQLFSIHHMDFLHEFSNYSHQNPKDSVQKAMEVYSSDGPQGLFSVFQNMINMHASGFTRKLFYAKFYAGIIESKELSMFETMYDSTLITEPYFIAVINQEHQKLKDYISNTNTGDINLATINSEITKDLLDSICTKYKNKVIYIDFWAPWCGPCMNEMPHSEKIQEHFKNDDVVFIYLANRCSKESWKATIANKNLSGEHILLTDDQFSVLSGILGINGIPHYTLIDKKGTIVWKDALRPSDKDKLIESINSLL